MSENKQRSKNTPEDVAIIAKAWAEGKDIEYWSRYEQKWIIRGDKTSAPNFHSDLYRVKPEPRTFELWLDTSLDVANPRVYHAPPGTDMSRYEAAGWTKINVKEIV